MRYTVIGQGPGNPQFSPRRFAIVQTTSLLVKIEKDFSTIGQTIELCVIKASWVFIERLEDINSDNIIERLEDINSDNIFPGSWIATFYVQL